MKVRFGLKEIKTSEKQKTLEHPGKTKLFNENCDACDDEERVFRDSPAS